MKKKNPVVHFEMPYENGKRMSNFYSSAFGWETNMLGEEMGNYILASTSEGDANGRPKEVGTINGGFHQKMDELPAQCPSIVIAVDDIHESMKKVREAGGEVIGEPVEIPGIGLYVSFFDTEGNRSSMLQPNPEM